MAFHGTTAVVQHRHYCYFYYYCHSSSLPLPFFFLFFVNHHPPSSYPTSTTAAIPPYPLRFLLAATRKFLPRDQDDEHHQQQEQHLIHALTAAAASASASPSPGCQHNCVSIRQESSPSPITAANLTAITKYTYDFTPSYDLHITTLCSVKLNDSVLYSLFYYLLSCFLTMDAKPLRKTRIRDENQIGVAIGRRKMMASAAGTKPASGSRKRLDQPAKRVALADATKYESTVANKVNDQTLKGGLSKPAVRGKPLAAKNSTASVATGAKAHQASSRPMVYRDNEENQIQNKVTVKAEQPQTGLGNASQQQGARKRPFVYRDEPEPAVSLNATSDVPAKVVAPLKTISTIEEHLPAVPAAEPLQSVGLRDNAEPAAAKPRIKIPDFMLGDPFIAALANLFEDISVPPPPPAVVYPPSHTGDPNAEVIRLKKVDGGATFVAVQCPADTSKRPYGSTITPDEMLSPLACTAYVAEQEAEWRAQFPERQKRPPSADPIVETKKNEFGKQCNPPADTNETRLVNGGLFPQWNDGIRREVARAHEICDHPSFRDPMLDDNDPNYVGEYADEILSYLMELDLNYLADPQYMANQPELRWDMRATLIDWLIEVHDRFQMVSETLYNAVNIIDRFLTRKAIPVDQLQLVGITALFIAAKYEEIHPPSIDSLIYMVDEAYTAEEIRACESYILRVNNWEINAPGPMNFLRYISTADHYQWDIRALAKYFLESTLMDTRFVGTPMSYTTAACYYLAMIMLNEGDWNVKHVHFSGYTAEQLRPAIEVLIEMMGIPQVHHPATFHKYSDKKFKRVAAFVEKWMMAQFQTLGTSYQPEDYDMSGYSKKTSKKSTKKMAPPKNRDVGAHAGDTVKASDVLQQVYA
ncbi:hypothetical protein H072_1270 [Dactylellina haptotyla CBS 200.50]|uniref:Uncharacterized protein n=1 Tax=Dactylellina haptotyla (strain CBS 200.50) TaxID=1284197 RepID=S8CAF7_DACHA|nr:hypothetical protein H072_1270 [Dactylellina haptotyla CBS 200.50]